MPRRAADRRTLLSPAAGSYILDRMDNDFKSKTRSELAEIVVQSGLKTYLADYLFTFIHQKHETDLNKITPLPKSFRQNLLDKGYIISSLITEQIQSDPDGTEKYLFTLPDGACIEAVRLVDDKRITLCISTQVGCRMGCRFCATGQLKFERNLSAAEIVDQVYQIESARGRANNIVYMGMGEPLDNYDEVVRSLRILHDVKGRNFGIRHITLSTCGLAEPILKLAELDLQPRLAVSLHAADDQTRSLLMQITKKEPLERLMEALRQYQARTGRRITFEYCMIDGVNDSPEHLSRLLLLLRNLQINVNLIELNTYPGCTYRPTPQPRIRKFALRFKEAGIETAIRFKKGRSISAACGQLGAERLPQKEKL